MAKEVVGWHVGVTGPPYALVTEENHNKLQDVQWLGRYFHTQVSKSIIC
jgi:hypothetical protein